MRIGRKKEGERKITFSIWKGKKKEETPMIYPEEGIRRSRQKEKREEIGGLL